MVFACGEKSSKMLPRLISLAAVVVSKTDVPTHIFRQRRQQARIHDLVCGRTTRLVPSSSGPERRRVFRLYSDGRLLLAWPWHCGSPQSDGRQFRAFPANPNWSFFIRPVVRHEPHRHRTRLCDPFRRRCVRAWLYDLVRGAPGSDACARRLGATERSGHYGIGRRLSARRSNLPSPFHVIACDTRRIVTGLRQSRTRAIS